MSNTVRITGTEKFVREAGDRIVQVLKVVQDTGTKEGTRPRYKGTFIRYLTIEG